MFANVFFFLWMSMFAYAYRKIRTDLIIPDGRILGGQDANIAEFPYMAKLYIEHQGSTILCGGIYVSKMWVLTAAHCLDINDVDEYPSLGRGRDRVRCIMGAQNNIKQRGYQKIKSTNLYFHPRYFRNYTHVYHDIGIIQLRKPFNLSKTVQVATLPTTGRSYEGKVVTIIGYGLSKLNVVTGQVTVPSQLQKLTTKVHESRFCRKLTHSLSVLCIGQAGKISCTGDSGGPMVYKKTVIGVCSYGFGCTSEYGIYEKISDNMDWIHSMLKLRRMQARSGCTRFNAHERIIFYWMLICYFILPLLQI